MITRVRYFKQTDGALESPNMQANDKAVKVRIVNNTFSILNAITGEFILGGRADTQHKLKIVIKENLRKIGVVFSDEVRKKVGQNETTVEEQPVA